MNNEVRLDKNNLPGFFRDILFKYLKKEKISFDKINALAYIWYYGQKTKKIYQLNIILV